MKCIFTCFSLTATLLALSFCTFAQSESRQKLSEIQARNRELTQLISQIATAVSQDKHKVMEPLLHDVMERIESIAGYAPSLPVAYANGVTTRTDRLRERALAFEGFVHKSSFLDKDKKLRQAFDDVKATNDDLTSYLRGVDQDLARLEKVAEPVPAPQPDVVNKSTTETTQTGQAAIAGIREAMTDIQNRIVRIEQLMKRSQFSAIEKEAARVGLSAQKIKDLSLLLDGDRKTTFGELATGLNRQADQLHHQAHKGKATHHQQHETFEAVKTRFQTMTVLVSTTE